MNKILDDNDNKYPGYNRDEENIFKYSADKPEKPSKKINTNNNASKSIPAASQISKFNDPINLNNRENFIDDFKKYLTTLESQNLIKVKSD